MPNDFAAIDPILTVRDLKVTFSSQENGTVHAVNGVNFELARGESLGLLGESGSGKSITLRAIMRLLPKSARIEGRVDFLNSDVLTARRRALRQLRGAGIAMIFQEPVSAMDPTCTIGHQIVEAILTHKPMSHGQAKQRAIELLDLVQIPSAAQRFGYYPQEMSGGMQQRAMIALALSCDPKLLLADEPTTALDVTVQIQVLLLLRRLQKELGMSLIFVTHDIGAAVEISDNLAVMYGGRIVETGTTREVVRTPRHPYSSGLIRSVVDRTPGRRLQGIPGKPPRLSSPPFDCVFYPRCTQASDTCHAQLPELDSGTHRVACFHPIDGALQTGEKVDEMTDARI